jgi:hypothetical protein
MSAARLPLASRLDVRLASGHLSFLQTVLATARSGNFLVASSCWNRAAGAGAALVRLSEVADWEEGGRTAAEHAARIFRREAAEGERRVLVARRQVRGGQLHM